MFFIIKGKNIIIKNENKINFFFNCLIWSFLNISIIQNNNNEGIKIIPIVLVKTAKPIETPARMSHLYSGEIKDLYKKYVLNKKIGKKKFSDIKIGENANIGGIKEMRIAIFRAFFLFINSFEISHAGNIIKEDNVALINFIAI